MEKEYKFVSAVVYIYNEQKNIQSFIRKLYGFFDNHFLKFEIICVDDASSDESVARIKELVKDENLANVSLISMDIYQGRELAMEAGVDLSIGDYVFELEWIDMFDPDHYEEVLWNAYTTSLKGYDVVSCASEGPKTLATSMFYKIYNKSSLNYNPLIPERFRIVTRRAINRVSRMNKTIVYRKALYANCGLRATTVGSNKIEKDMTNKNVQRNKSKLGTTVLLSYTSFFQKIGMVLNILLTLNFAGALIFALSRLILQENIGTVGITWLIVSFPTLFLGIIGMILLKYQELVLELILKKENYVVGSVDKLVNSEK